VPERVDIFVGSMLSARIGDDHHPRTSRTVASWPGLAPGDRGVLNLTAPAVDDAVHRPHLGQPQRFLTGLGGHLSSA